MTRTPYQSITGARLWIFVLGALALLFADPSSSEGSDGVVASTSDHGGAITRDSGGGPACMIEPWECLEEEPAICIQEFGAPCPEQPACMIEPWECPEEEPTICIQEVGAPCPEGEPATHQATSSSPIHSIPVTGSGEAGPGTRKASRPNMRSCRKGRVRKGDRCVRKCAGVARVCRKPKTMGWPKAVFGASHNSRFAGEPHASVSMSALSP